MSVLTGFSVRIKLFLFVTFFFILFNSFPLLADLTNIQINIVCIITAVSLLVLFPQTMFSKPLKWFYSFIFILFLNGIMGRYVHINGLDNLTLPFMWRLTIEIAWILPALQIMSILLYLNNQRLFKVIGYGSVLILAISFVYILPLLMSHSNILREAMHEENLDFVKPIGLPDYTLMHSYTLMLPGLCLYTKSHIGKHRYISLALVALFFYIITQTAVSTSLGLSIMIFLFSFFYDDRRKVKTIFVLVLFAILSILAYQLGLVLSLVDSLMPFFEGTAVEPKLIDLHNSIIAGQLQGGSIEGRANLHDISKDAFWENPFFGGGRAGKHSHVFDLLGSVGLFGFIPFFMIIWSSLKKYSLIVNDGLCRKFLYLCFAIAGVYLYHKGIFGATGWLFMCVIAPSLIVAVNNDNKA